MISSFTSHLSRYHQEQNVYTLAVDSEADHIFVDEDMNNIEDEMLDTSQSIVAYTNPETPVIGYAMLLLSMRYQHLIPALTVEKITKNITGLLNTPKQNVLQSITAIFENQNLPESICKKIVDSVSSSFGTSHYFEGKLRSDYMRNQFFESAIPYVAPVAYNLPFSGQSLVESYQYVPILQSLKML